MKKLAVANGTYQKDGQEKTRWVNVGIINTSTNGKEYMLIDPTINFAAFSREDGKDMVMVGMFEEQNDGGQQQQSYNAPQQQQQSYQAPSQQQQPQQGYNAPPTQHVNAQNQIIDANGQFILDGNGQIQQAQQ